MTLLVILAVSAVLILGYIAVSLVLDVRDDGYHHPARTTPPRSHHPDPFDPHSRLA
ncbi:MAG TPA: hypothetical protein VER39_10885 [Nocardioidaceae bacterium]|nr:hypothetical protein [Nocardioidaceae bacterium]